ncbi:MAG: NERD domain-containing protein [bacterium]
MPRIFPSPFPFDIKDEPGRKAESKVYHAFKEQLSPEHTIFYSRSWLGKPGSGAPVDGEADFVVAHPESGFMVVEVKGGGIGYDGKRDKWTSTDRHKQKHRISNPFEQAKLTKHALIKKIKQLPAWKRRWLDAGHAVIFPDSARPARPLLAESSPEMVAFEGDMRWLDKWLESAFDYWAGEYDNKSDLGERGIEVLEQLLAPVFELKQPIHPELHEDEQEIIRLTEEQFGLLDLLSGQRRVAISGGAGTGKTMLAMEKARRLAAEGFRTLLTCYNRPLADYMNQTLGKNENLTVMNFHSMCYHLGKKAEVDVPDLDGDPGPEVYDKELPAVLVKALECLADERFDAIVVDEGQDFLEDWWTILQFALSDPEQGVMYIFFDDNQRIFRSVDALPEGLQPFSLSKNLRNTKAIHKLASTFYVGGALEAGGPDGRPVEFIKAAGDKAIAKEVSRVLHKLIKEESIDPGEIAVLIGRSRDESKLVKDGRIGAFPVASYQQGEQDKVLLESIRRFKGLERLVVVLALLEDILDSPELLYVGLTRAKAHLVVVGDDAVIEAVKGA